MKKTICTPNTVPMVNLAINKGRLKVYKNVGKFPTYYLQKGSEFQIELFNPTIDVVLAKITLNDKPISQGGLILNPGERVFLDRYLDVAKKFLFDTYEVSNTDEVKKAIEHNGDLKVEFYKETSLYYNNYTSLTYNSPTYNSPTYTYNNAYCVGVTLTNTGPNNTSSFLCASDNHSVSNDVSVKKEAKAIETGRIEMGSSSNQKFEYVDKSFHYYPFLTVEYKILPVSQKINTTDDIGVKLYCKNCGQKFGKKDRFCSGCGNKK
jgi:hypothetical protein